MSITRLVRIADRLAQIDGGSRAADDIIHKALNRNGPVFSYSRNDAAARLLLPSSFEWRDPTYSPGVVYASCCRIGLHDGQVYDPHGQWATTLALATCGAALRAHVSLAKG